MGAAFALPKARLIALPALRVVDTGGPVEMGKCSPCHIDLGAFKNPKLVNFSHPVHFKRGIRCQVCHVVFPHRPGGTVKPTMDQCGNCHRLQHGNLGRMAPANCDLCHPKDFKLKPADHEAKDFAGRVHADAAKATVQSCLVCHKSDSCEGCHAKSGVAPAPAAAYRWFGLWPVPKESGLKITIGASPVTMSACQACHGDLQKWKNDKLVNFNHPAHFKRQITCDKCHDKWPHSPGKLEKPKMAACVRCHRLDHAAQGRLVAAEKGTYPNEYCAVCHPKDMKLKPDWHTPAFIGGDHKRFAKADRGLCRGCHIQAFCDNCHQTEIPHAPGWLGEHGKVAAALSDQGKIPLPCFKCHLENGPKEPYQTAPSCAKCHKAVVYPHRKPWAPQHGKTAKSVGLSVCTTCHVKAVFCDKCHGSVKMPHDKSWLGEHREFLRDNDPEACLRCHKAAQCEQCHATHKVHNRHTIYKMGP